MKAITLLFILANFLFFSCDEDSPTDELYESESIIPGLYKKQVSQTDAYLKITSTQGFLCRVQDNIEFSGNIVDNTVHFEVDGSIRQTELKQEGNNLWARNLVNNTYLEWTEYFPTDDSYPCTGNSNGGNTFTNGNVKFWIKENAYYNPVTITLRLSGYPDRVSIVTGGFPSNYDVNCDVPYQAGNFYDLPVGSYQTIYEYSDGNIYYPGVLVVQSFYGTPNSNANDCQVFEFYGS